MAAEFDITLLKVRKLLITAGYMLQIPLSRYRILRYRERRYPGDYGNHRAKQGIGTFLLFRYKKGIYNAKEASLDAERCKKYRQRKSAVARLKEKPDNLELLWDAMVAFAEYPFQTYPKGLKFKYEVKGNEIFVNRKKKSITKATVVLAYQNMAGRGNKKSKGTGNFWCVLFLSGVFVFGNKIGIDKHMFYQYN